jgi:uncharacterized membrane protein
MASSKPRTATRSGSTAKNRGGNGAGQAARPSAQNRSAAQNRQAPQTKKARDRAKARELAERATVAEPEAAGPPLWVQIVSLVLALLGLGVSIYLTIEHFTGNTTLACSDKGLVNCGAVTTSPESMVFGVFPVAVLGLAFFVFAVPMLTPWAWRSHRREIAVARLASMVVGVGFILYLIYVELIQVGAICLWCTSVHVITFLLFVLVAMSAAVYGLPRHWGGPPKPPARTAR